MERRSQFVDANCQSYLRDLASSESIRTASLGKRNSKSHRKFPHPQLRTEPLVLRRGSSRSRRISGRLDSSEPAEALAAQHR